MNNIIYILQIMDSYLKFDENIFCGILRKSNILKTLLFMGCSAGIMNGNRYLKPGAFWYVFFFLITFMCADYLRNLFCI